MSQQIFIVIGGLFLVILFICLFFLIRDVSGYDSPKYRPIKGYGMHNNINRLRSRGLKRSYYHSAQLRSIEQPESVKSRLPGSKICQAYFLPDINLYKTEQLGDGKKIFKDKVTVDASAGDVDTVSFNNPFIRYAGNMHISTANTVNNLNLQDIIEKVDVAGTDFLMEKVYNANKTISDIIGSDSNIVNELIYNSNNYYGYLMDIKNTHSVIEMETDMYKEEYFDPLFLNALVKLVNDNPITSVPDPNSPSEKYTENTGEHVDDSQFEPYRAFLKEWGSHVVTGAIYGKRVTAWETNNKGNQQKYPPLYSGTPVIIKEGVKPLVQEGNNLIFTENQETQLWVFHKKDTSVDSIIRNGDLVSIQKENMYISGANNTESIPIKLVNGETDDCYWTIETAGTFLYPDTVFSLKGSQYYASIRESDTGTSIPIYSTLRESKFTFSIYPNNRTTSDVISSMNIKQCLLQNKAQKTLSTEWNQDQPVCMQNIQEKQIDESKYINTTRLLNVIGGSEEITKTLFNDGITLEMDHDKLNALINEPESMDGIIERVYTPIWRLLFDIYSGECSRSQFSRYSYKMKTVPYTCTGVVMDPGYVIDFINNERNNYGEHLESLPNSPPTLIKFEATNENIKTLTSDKAKIGFIHIDEYPVTNFTDGLVSIGQITKNIAISDKLMIEGDLPDSLSYENGYDITFILNSMLKGGGEALSVLQANYKNSLACILAIGNYSPEFNSNIVKFLITYYGKDISSEYNLVMHPVQTSIDEDNTVLLTVRFIIDTGYEVQEFEGTFKVYSTGLLLVGPDLVAPKVENTRYLAEPTNNFTIISKDTSSISMYIGSVRLGCDIDSIDISGNITPIGTIGYNSNLLSLSIGKYNQFAWVLPPIDAGYVKNININQSFTYNSLQRYEEKHTIMEGDQIYLKISNMENWKIENFTIRIKPKRLVLATVGNNVIYCPSNIGIGGDKFYTVLGITNNDIKQDDEIKINGYLLHKFFEVDPYVPVYKYERNSGTFTLNKCTESEDKIGAMCYKKCLPGFHPNSEDPFTCMNDNPEKLTSIQRSSFNAESYKKKPDYYTHYRISNTCDPVIEVGAQGLCFIKCHPGENMTNGKCQPLCNPGDVQQGDMCYQPCPQNTELLNGKCMSPCPDGYITNGDLCIKNTEKRESKSYPIKEYIRPYNYFPVHQATFTGNTCGGPYPAPNPDISYE